MKPSLRPKGELFCQVQDTHTLLAFFSCVICTHAHRIVENSETLKVIVGLFLKTAANDVCVCETRAGTGHVTAHYVRDGHGPPSLSKVSLVVLILMDVYFQAQGAN